MSKWHNTIGYPQLGSEHTDDYRGYVVQVDSAPNPERWFTYAYDQEDQHTYWIGMTGSEADAKAVLERLIAEGWKCEIYDSRAGRHCRDAAAMVKHTYYQRNGRAGERLRLLLCEGHEHVFSDWEQMTIRDYVNTYNGLEQDGPIMGPRR